MSKYKMLFVFVTALCSLIPALLFGQVDTAWVRRYNGPGNSTDGAYAMAVDGAGNVYITGGSYSGSATFGDYATIKYVQTGACD
jgi:ABC-type phosphate/phosphonate transport system substrate-binding protein